MHGWSLNELIDVLELVPPESLLDADQQQSLLYSSDLELGETTKVMFEAIERSGVRVDLLVADYAMPGMTGLELAGAARELRPNLPVLLATAYAELPSGSDGRPASPGRALPPGPLATEIAKALRSSQH